MTTQANFVLYTGPMFSSKTTKLLARIDRGKYQKKSVLSFKPSLDSRYTIDNQIVTHNDMHTKCLMIKSGKNILEIVADHQPVDIIAIDELFMIPGGGEACIELFKKGYDVYVSSIELDFLGEPFNEVSKIMPYCTQIVKCKAVCSICQEDARYTTKKGDVHFPSPGDSVLQVGGKETYEPRCQLHHKHLRL